jgi:cytoskeletal protein RodZ
MRSVLKGKKGEMNMGLIVLLVMGIVVAIAMLPEIFNQQASMTTKNTVTDESVNVGSAKLGGSTSFNASVPLSAVSLAPTAGSWQSVDCPLESITVSNASGAGLTLTTDYTFNTVTGVLNVKNTTTTIVAFASSNSSLIDYTYCQDGYNKDSGSRGIAGLIGLFAVFALLAFVIYYGVNEWIN